MPPVKLLPTLPAEPLTLTQSGKLPAKATVLSVAGVPQLMLAAETISNAINIFGDIHDKIVGLRAK